MLPVADRRPAARRRCRGDAGELTLPVILGAGVGVLLLALLAVRIAYATAVVGHDDKPRVLVLGDSITDRGQRYLKDEMSGSYALSIDGRASFRADMLLPTAERWATRDFRQVVINLGTNDIVQGWPTDQSVQALRALVALYPGADCVHLVTINERLPDDTGPNVKVQARALNERIRSLVASDPRLRLIDWAAIVDDLVRKGIEPTLDGVHPTPDAHELLAQAMARSLASCPAPAKS